MTSLPWPQVQRNPGALVNRHRSLGTADPPKLTWLEKVGSKHTELLFPQVGVAASGPHAAKASVKMTDSIQMPQGTQYESSPVRSSPRPVSPDRPPVTQKKGTHCIFSKPNYQEHSDAKKPRASLARPDHHSETPTSCLQVFSDPATKIPETPKSRVGAQSPSY